LKAVPALSLFPTMDFMMKTSFLQQQSCVGNDPWKLENNFDRMHMLQLVHPEELLMLN